MAPLSKLSLDPNHILKFSALPLGKKKRRLVLPDQEKYDSCSWKRKNTWRLDSKFLIFKSVGTDKN